MLTDPHDNNFNMKLYLRLTLWLFMYIKNICLKHRVDSAESKPHDAHQEGDDQHIIVAVFHLF